ncbi:MAG: RDD family protein [Candidatus Obscuribacterales bacterium]|nr:RDD family protein [Candidatus Obscuribacterales bacterium]
MKEPFKEQYDNPEERRQEASWEDKLNAYGRYSRNEKLAVTPTRIAMDKRFVALLIDVAVGWIIGLVVNFIPFVSIFIQAQTTMVFYLLIKDGLYGGRGVGKNLMGLQVVDIKTGQGANIGQSIKRNLVLFGPTLLLYFISTILKIIPNETINTLVMSTVDTIGGIYILLAIPYETYRAYSRPDGQRWGDHFAGSTIVESSTDFRQIFPR